MSQQISGTTLNLINENLQALKQLFPEAFSEDRVDFERLQLLLGKDVINDNEKYSFTWKGKNDAIKLALAQTTGTLRPDKASSKNWDTTENLYIEGDNLEVLRCLQDTYRGQIKMIYIDPPYNTGKDFVYKDDFVDNVASYKEKMGENMKSNPETNGRYHTDWLNMMYPRLKLARNLLKDDGVIFISIDDNEITNLKRICDEIFLEENFINNFMWLHGKGKKDKNSRTLQQYILCYAKDKNIINSWSITRQKEYVFTNPDNDKKGSWFSGSVSFSEERSNKNHPNYFSITSPSGILWERQWQLPEEELVDLIANGDIFFGNPPEYNNVPRLKVRPGNTGEIIPENILFGFSSQRDASNELAGLFNGKEIFDYPKPTDLIQHFLKLVTVENEIILDFFSGSATTAQSTMQLNYEDSGNRRFILIQIPEETIKNKEAFNAGYTNICEVGKERIRRAGEKIKLENKDKPGIDKLDIGFKCFTLDTTNLKKWDNDIRGKDIIQTLFDHTSIIKEGREDIDMVYEVMLKYGIDLTDPVEEITLGGKSYFSVSMGHMIAYFGKDMNLAGIKLIVAEQPKVVVIYDDAFESNPVKINAIENLEKAGIKVLIF